jgi:hypothetical protein
MSLGKVNQWWQLNNIKFFLIFFAVWFILLVFVILIYLNSLCKSATLKM